MSPAEFIHSFNVSHLFLTGNLLSARLWRLTNQSIVASLSLPEISGIPRTKLNEHDDREHCRPRLRNIEIAL